MYTYTLADLRQYQKRIIRDAWNYQRAFIMLKMGRGKTIIAATLAERLIAHKKTRAFLVIGPLKPIHLVWPKHLKEWQHLNHCTYRILHGPNKDGMLSPGVDFYFMNFEGIQWLCDWIDKVKRRKSFTGLPFDSVIIDESAMMRNPGSKRFGKYRYRVKFIPRYRYNLTGKPTPKGLENIWSQMYCLHEDTVFGSSFVEWQWENFTPKDHNMYKWEIRSPMHRAKIISKVRPHVLALTQEEEIHMPPRINNFIYVKPSKKFYEAYYQMEREFYLELKGKIVRAKSEASKRMKLRQICQGMMYDYTGMPIKIHNEKQLCLKELADKTETETEKHSDVLGNTIIVYNFRFEVTELLEVFPKAPYIDGSTDEQNDHMVLEKWNQQQVPILLLNAASINYGLNLQYGGYTMLWYGLTDDLDKYDQLVGRLDDRIGQEHQVTVHHILIEDTVDEIIKRNIQKKDADQTSFINDVTAYLERKWG